METVIIEKVREAGKRKTVLNINGLNVVVTSNEPSEEAIARFNRIFVRKALEGKIDR